MASQVDICNRALLSIGARAQISSITPSDGSTEANACSVLFSSTFEALARATQWNCLRKQGLLSLLAAASGTPENPTGTTLPLPPTPWLYQYGLPSDCLAVRFLVPSLPSAGLGASPTTLSNQAPTWVWTTSGKIPFAVAYATDNSGNPIQIVLTNQDQAQAVYTVNQGNPAIWDSKFQAAMVASLAAYLVPALSLNMPLMQASIATAERLIGEARVADGNEGDMVLDHVPDWIRARRGAGGMAPWLDGGIPNADFANSMIWPTY